MAILLSPSLLFFLLSPLTWLNAVLGLILGSFFNVCIMRVPEGTFWRSSRSLCPNCGSKIPFWFNIPIISYVILRGKSHCCRTRISMQYPIVELLSCVLLTIIFWCFPFVERNVGGISFDQIEFLRYLHAAVFCGLLIVASFIDFKWFIIPDGISLGLVLSSPLIVWLHPELTWRSSLYGVLLGGGLIYAVAWIYVLIRKVEGIGMGDAKLLAGIGGWLGFEAILPTIFWAAIIGTLYSLVLIVIQRSFNSKMEIPFGPFLSIAALFFLLQSTLHQFSI